MNDQTPTSSKGWWPNPDGTVTERFFDGTAWTDMVRDPDKPPGRPWWRHKRVAVPAVVVAALAIASIGSSSDPEEAAPATTTTAPVTTTTAPPTTTTAAPATTAAATPVTAAKPAPTTTTFNEADLDAIRGMLLAEYVYDNLGPTVPASTAREMVLEACSALNQGATAFELVYTLVSNVPVHQQEQISKVLGFGLGLYCPEAARAAGFPM